MASTNLKTAAMGSRDRTLRTHEGAPAVSLSPLRELRRAALATLLWENTFYENGQSIADRIATLSGKVGTDDVLALAREARSKYRLRHVPLWLLRSVIKQGAGGAKVGQALTDIIQRADELTEFLALYWKDGKTPLSKQVKVGLANAFQKFDAYQLAKYNRDEKDIKLRDVMFLTHPKPKDEAQAATWKALVDGTLESPDTWEVALSAGKDKKETFERLIRENKLGYMALLRNLRNMVDAKVDRALIRDALIKGATRSKALPFRYIAAARAAPSLEAEIDESMQLAMGSMEKLSGSTAILVDVSGSMGTALSGKSDLNRIDAACGLAVLARGVCDDVQVFAFSDKLVQVPARKGMALVDAIKTSQRPSGTYLGAALRTLNEKVGKFDRVVVVTDEQTADRVPQPSGKGYIVNVAGYKNGISYGPWTNITGWSEGVIDYIREIERSG